ncbi:MAG: hypothetical protein IKN64_02180 [Desulfovibrio sp.]|nr:hypothetical protein [Desulfovibrio sp.]
MPFCLCRTSCAVDVEQEKKLQSLLGEAVAMALGFSPNSLLLGVEDNVRLSLGGKRGEKLAYLELHIFAHETHEDHALLTSAITNILHTLLAIPKDNIFVNYTDIPCFGAGGRTFESKRGLLREPE